MGFHAHVLVLFKFPPMLHTFTVKEKKNEKLSDLSSFFLLASIVFDNFKTPTLAIQISNAQNIYDRVSDVVESCVKFANKILTHHRMH